MARAGLPCQDSVFCRPKRERALAEVISLGKGRCVDTLMQPCRKLGEEPSPPSGGMEKCHSLGG